MSVFRRLTIILALFTLIGLLGVSEYFYYNYKLEHKLVSESYETLNDANKKCKRNSSSVACWLADEERKYLYEHVDIQYNYWNKAKIYLILALGLPIFILLIYFSYGWIVYGKIPSIKNK